MYLQYVPYATSYICTHKIQNVTIVFSDIIIVLHFTNVWDLNFEGFTLKKPNIWKGHIHTSPHGDLGNTF